MAVAVVVEADVVGAYAVLVAIMVVYREVARYRAGGGGFNAGEHGAGRRQLWDGGQVTQWKYDFINVPFFLLLLPPKCEEMYVSGEEKGKRGEWKEREGRPGEGQGRDQCKGRKGTIREWKGKERKGRGGSRKRPVLGKGRDKR